MADKVTVDNGSGTDYDVATDDVTVDGYGATAQVQLMKLVSGPNGETAPIPGDTDTTSKKGLYVVNHPQAKRIVVATSTLTIATTAYSLGDQVSPELTFANAARYSGGTGLITGITLVDKNDIIGSYDIVISRVTMTLAGDNVAWAVSDADALNILAVVQLDTAIDIGGNRFAQAQNLAIPFDCGATSLFVSMITRTAHTFFAAHTDLQLALFVVQD
jgi:hypothetical protein